MQSTRRRLLALAPGAVLARASCVQASTGASEGIDAAARAFMERSRVPGLAIGVVTPAGAQVSCYGVASVETGRAVDGRTLFEIGSVSKTFTVALAAHAAEVGAIEWDEPASRHLPILRGSALDGVSLLDLATHTTGGMPLQLPDGVRTTADLLAYFRDWKPAAPPGSVRTYSNASIGLLGLVAARALKGSFAALVHEHVCAPLGLRHTFHDVPAAEQREGRYAQGYTRDGRPVRLTAAPLSTEAYGIRTTVEDLLRFVQAQLGGIEVDAPLRRALAATHVGHYRAGPMTQALVWEWYRLPVSPDDVAVGNGEAMVLEPNRVRRLEPPQPPPGAALVNKTGATNGFGAYVAFVPARRVGLVVLANRNHPTPLRLALAAQVFASLGVTGIAGPPGVAGAGIGTFRPPGTVRVG